jgi:LEA14-like dessication related protein
MSTPKNILSILIAFGILFFVAGCTSFQKPQFRSIEKITYKGITDDGLKLDAKINIYNPNSKNIKVHKADLDVYIDNSRIGKITIDQMVTLNPRTESPCIFSVLIEPSSKNKMSFQIINKIIRRDISISFKGTVQVQTGILKKTVLVDETIQRKDVQ